MDNEFRIAINVWKTTITYTSFNNIVYAISSLLNNNL